MSFFILAEDDARKIRSTVFNHASVRLCCVPEAMLADEGDLFSASGVPSCRFGHCAARYVCKKMFPVWRSRRKKCD